MFTRRLRVVVDERERRSGIPVLLKKFGLHVEYRMLDVGDYVVSPECAIERKAERDFLKSLYSGRLFDQARQLRELYEHPVLIVEGNFPHSISELEKPKTFWGTLATLTFQHSLNLFFTANTQQTADLIHTLAQKTSVKPKGGPFVRRKPKVKDIEKAQLTLVSSLPGIGPKLADRALRRFRTVRKVYSASIAELSSVEGIGRTTAEKIAKLLDASYPSASTKPQQLALNQT